MPTGRSLLTQETKYAYKLERRQVKTVTVTGYLRDEGAGHLYHKSMQDEGNVEQRQTAVHEDHLVDERRGELAANLAEQGDVDQPQQAGTYPGHDAQEEPLTSGGLGHFKQTASSATFRGYFRPRESSYKLG